MEDIELGRDTHTSTRVVTALFATPGQIVPANTKRIHLAFYFLANAASVLPSQGGIALTSGIALSATSGPLEFDITTHGNVVMQAWDGAGNGADANIIVMETFLNKG